MHTSGLCFMQLNMDSKWQMKWDWSIGWMCTVDVWELHCPINKRKESFSRPLIKITQNFLMVFDMIAETRLNLQRQLSTIMKNWVSIHGRKQSFFRTH